MSVAERARSARWRQLAVGGSALAIVAGGWLVYDGIATSPAARIARLTHLDHVRARSLASQRAIAPRQGGSRLVPFTPTVSGEVAEISIPALAVSAPVVAEGPVNGELTIPADVHTVGWDEQTPSPGAPGVTLLAGHVNWVGQGEGALGEIGQLVPGDLVYLNWGGRETEWRVDTKPVLSPNTVVHPQLFTTQGPPTLALVTCGGPFTEVPGVGGSYADNVIVEASLVG